MLAVTTTGAQALHYVDTLDDGVIVCGYRLSDMMYSDIRDYLPDSFQLLLIASADKWGDGLEEGVVGLPMPIKVYDLVNTPGNDPADHETKEKKTQGSFKEPGS